MEIATLTDARRNVIRAMVKELGHEPHQDLHFDLWNYRPGQPMVSYDKCVIREYLELKGVESPALLAMADYLRMRPEYLTTSA